MLKFYSIFSFIIVTVSIKSQTVFNKSVYDSLTTNLELCDSSGFHDFYTLSYCNNDTVQLQINYGKTTQNNDTIFSLNSITNWIFRGDKLIQLDFYKADFSKPDTGLASVKYLYSGNNVKEKLRVDKNGRLTTNISRITHKYLDQKTIETNQFDRHGNYVCSGDAFNASTRIYSLDSLNRIIEINYWCKDKKPYKHIAKELTQYINNPENHYYESYYNSDSLYIIKSSSIEPDYFSQF